MIYKLILVSTFLFTLLFGTSCTSVKKGKKIIPIGTYCHRVQVSVNNKPAFTLKGVQKLTPNSLQIVGLSNFGHTLLSYKKTFNSRNEKLYYDNNLIPVGQRKIKKMIKLISYIYQIDSSSCQNQQCKNRNSGFEYTSYLKNNSVKRIEIKREALMTINIHMVSCQNG